MSAKKVVKGLATGAILAGVAALAIKMKEEKNKKKAKEMVDHAQFITAKVMKHAEKLGKLTKSAYNKIVDTAVDEYRGIKDISDDEIKEMKAELKESWDDVNRIMKGETGPVKKKSAANKKPASKKGKKK